MSTPQPRGERTRRSGLPDADAGLIRPGLRTVLGSDIACRSSGAHAHGRQGFA
jgi:hypothetical protein